MTTRIIVRVLAVLTLACTAGLLVFKPVSGKSDNPFVLACTDAPDKATRIETCSKALELDGLTNSERGDTAFYLARAVAPDDAERAVALYTQSITLTPDNMSAFLNRGALYRKAREYDLAVADFSTVIGHINRKNADQLFDVYLQRARVLKIQDKFTEAMADVDAALDYDPDNIDAIEAKADILSEQDRDADALLVLNEAIARLPQDSNVIPLRKARAWSNGNLFNLDEAFADVETILEMGDNSAWTWFWRGLLHWEIGDRKAAYWDFRKSLAINPHYCRSIWSMNVWSNTLWEMGETTPLKARDILDDVLAEHPDDPKLLDLRYHFSLQAEGRETALQDLNRLIEAADYPDWWISIRAGTNMRLGRNDLALADLNVLIDKNETREDVILQTHYEIEELLKAGKRCVTEELVSDNLNLMTLYASSLRRKTEILVAAGDWNAALATLNLRVEHDPDGVDHLRKRGVVLEKLGRPNDALASYDQAIRLIETEEGERSNSENGYADTYDYRGSIHQSRHRADQAQADFDSALKRGNAEFAKAFQRRMQSAGHYDGSINGTYDTATKDALQLCASDIHCIDPEASDRLKQD